MAYKFKLQQFEGPLDLLLQLIEQEEMDINQIALAHVTDQYLRYLNDSKDILPEELADFLVVAAKLLLIKSKSLLPGLQVDDDEGTDLERQLKMYKEFYEASKVLHKMILKRHFSFTREKMVVKIDRVFNPPKHLTSEKLRELFSDVLASLEVWVSMEHDVIIKTVSIRERIRNIQEMIGTKATLHFNELMKTAKNKTEVIVTFLAILELVKQRWVGVVQEGTFSDIVVRKIEGAEGEVVKETI
ncbi:MAG: ScpA family protein [Patescibacteria group bacterium]|jgi:segregation and condensation protein A